MKSYISRKFPLATRTIERKPVGFGPGVIAAQDSSPCVACIIRKASYGLAVYAITRLPVLATPELFV